jgi:hypothetical protein
MTDPAVAQAGTSAGSGIASAPPRDRARRRSRLALASLLACVAAINLLCMPAVFWAGDPGIWREEARSILRGELAVDSRLAAGFGERGQWFVPNTTGGVTRWYSKYGIANSIVLLPPTLVDSWRIGRRRAPGERPDLLIFNLYHACIALLACAVLYGLAGRYTQRLGTRVVYTVAVLYATFVWYYQRAQSSELYQILFYSAFFYCFVEYLLDLKRDEPRGGSRRAGWILGAWFFAGLLAFTRIVFVLLYAVILAGSCFSLWSLKPNVRTRVAQRELKYLLIPACALAGLMAWVNAAKFGSPLLTGYHVWRPEQHWPAWGCWTGLYGYLFDMRGSVLWYFPVVLFAALGFRRFQREHRVDALVMCSVALLFYAVLGKTPTWLGEWTYGPRYMIFTLPVLALPFITWIDTLLDEPRRRHHWVAGAVAAAALVYSAYLTERQNRLDFFASYRARDLVDSYRNAEIDSYFTGHHLGWICWDLLAHRNQLDELPFMQRLPTREIPQVELTQVKIRLRNLISLENYYWRRPQRRLSMK